MYLGAVKCKRLKLVVVVVVVVVDVAAAAGALAVAVVVVVVVVGVVLLVAVRLGGCIAVLRCRTCLAAVWLCCVAGGSLRCILVVASGFICMLYVCNTSTFADGHTVSNAPDLF